MEKLKQFIAVVPAAGVGKRMKANCPKQYLCINNKAILTHTVMKLLEHERISKVIIALGIDDQYFSESELVHHSNIIRVDGGKDAVGRPEHWLSQVRGAFGWVGRRGAETRKTQSLQDR